ncbi:hypothetical protein JCM3765_004271 [Sporobolomyces pararoseus]
MENLQDVVDRLVVVTEEQDVLYTLVVLGQMNELGFPLQALEGRHSWKGYSAWEVIIRTSKLSILHRLIAQILLLAGVRCGIEDVQDFTNQELRDLLLNWEKSGRGDARDAQLLLSLEINDAADWIDENLPLPPDSDKLTGNGPLPLPPTTYIPSVNYHAKASQLEDTGRTPLSDSSRPPFPKESTLDPTWTSEGSSTPLLLPLLEGSPSELRRESVSSSRSSLVSTRSPIFESLPNFLSPTAQQISLSQTPSEKTRITLHIAGLRKGFTEGELVDLFLRINVQVENPRLVFRASDSTTMGFVEVKTSDNPASHVVFAPEALFDGRKLHDLRSSRVNVISPTLHDVLEREAQPF